MLRAVSRITSLVALILLLATPAMGVTRAEWRSAWSYAHEVNGLMSEGDFDLLMLFQDSTFRRNAMMTPVVRDLLDDRISGYDWAIRHSGSVARLNEFASEQRLLASKVRDASLKRYLVQFADLSQRQADAFANLRRAFISMDEDAAAIHWDEVAMNGRLRVQYGMPILNRLREKLGADIVDRHLEAHIASLVKGVTPR